MPTPGLARLPRFAGGGSVSFPGRTDYIRTGGGGDPFDHNIGSGDFTFACWARCFDTSLTNQFVASNGDDYRPGFVWNRGGIIAFYNNTDGWLAFDATLEQDRWYHLAWVRRGSTVYCYVDGIQESTTHTTTYSWQEHEFSIGAPGALEHIFGFSGCQHDVALWRRGLTPTEIWGIAREKKSPRFYERDIVLHLELRDLANLVDPYTRRNFSITGNVTVAPREMQVLLPEPRIIPFGAAAPATIDLVGTLVSSAALSAQLDLLPAAVVDLQAALATSSSASAALDLGVDLAAGLTSSSSVAALLDLGVDLAAALAASSTILADVELGMDLSASLTASSTITAALELSLPGSVDLAASLATGSSVAVVLDLGVDLSASLTASSTVSAALDRGIDLAAALSGGSAVVAVLDLVQNLAAVLTSSSVVACHLDTGELLGVRRHQGFAVCRLAVEDLAVARLRVPGGGN